MHPDYFRRDKGPILAELPQACSNPAVDRRVRDWRHHETFLPGRLYIVRAHPREEPTRPDGEPPIMCSIRRIDRSGSLHFCPTISRDDARLDSDKMLRASLELLAQLEVVEPDMHELVRIIDKIHCYDAAALLDALIKTGVVTKAHLQGAVHLLRLEDAQPEGE